MPCVNTHKGFSGYSNACTSTNFRARVWDLASANAASNGMTAGSGLKEGPAAARFFQSACQDLKQVKTPEPRNESLRINVTA